MTTQARKQHVISYEDAKSQGLKRFFTGEPCKHGHVGERYVAGLVCVVCDTTRNKNYRNTTKYKAAMRGWDAKRRVQQVTYQRKRRASNPQYAVTARLRRRLNLALQAARVGKSVSAVNDCGCTLEELMVYIERQFVWGMAWHNRELWHLDHIKPLAAFNLTDPEQQREACHFSNLQPLWGTENLRKGARMVEP